MYLNQITIKHRFTRHYVQEYLGYHSGSLCLCVGGECVFSEMCVAGSGEGGSSNQAQGDREMSRRMQFVFLL